MTDHPHGSARRYVGLVTTAVVSLGAAAAVGWAAAVPVRNSGASTPATPVSDTTSATRQIEAARGNLQQVRRDLARMLSEEDDLPRAQLANLPALVAQLPSVQVPQSSSTQPIVTQVAPAPPVTQTTTGASGAHP
ncbi:MAG TPA: hypothetical protein VFJ17_05060 [Mycobacteriales bacterium]|jgi:hypothetical protein|nr:hypothetical protein [Mycobacteriales bacterium]